MLISMAYAQEAVVDAVNEVDMMDAPSATSAFIWNMGLILVLVVMFYVLLIRPQQKRFQEHKLMMDNLKVGDKVSTAGGLVGKIAKLDNETEVTVDLGNDVKVTALRHTLSDIIESKDSKKDKK